MATEYISREAAIETLKSIAFNHWFECGEYVGEESVQISVINADKAFEAIEAVPAADVRPVVRAEWIVSDHGDYQLIECDQCHAQMWNHQSELPNYCYECGADMRKVVEIDQVKEGEDA